MRRGGVVEMGIPVSTGGVQRLLTLPPIPESARAARRFVGEVVSAAQADEFLDNAQLLTSELVTNGIVHAHTDLQVFIEATATWVRVDIVDESPMLPSQREYDDDAATGRGLGLVEMLADDFGVEHAGAGKRVWFRLGAQPGVPASEPAPPSTAAVRSTTTAVTFLSLPVALYCAWQQHAEAMLRETTLAALDDDESPIQAAASPLAGLALGALADAAHEIFALRDADVSNADVSLKLATDALPWFGVLRDTLGRATAMSHAGQLLVPPALPEIAGLRNWLCDQVMHQTTGLPATPWAGIEHDKAAPVEVSADTLAQIRDATAALVAADVTNRIVAVSRSAAELLGWAASELEGRRLVTIIPTRLRDRHVAGFSRHLLDGTTTILDRAVPVTALRRDGSEIDVTLHIRRRSDPMTRALFVATLNPG